MASPMQTRRWPRPATGWAVDPGYLTTASALAAGNRIGSASGLKAAIAASRRRSQIRLVLLAAPLILYTLVGFAMPLALMLDRSVDNSLLAGNLPSTAEALAEWSGDELPGEGAFEALAADLRRIEAAGKTALIGKHLNYELEGFRALVVATVRGMLDSAAENRTIPLREIDARWNELQYWQVLKRAARSLTWRNLLAAVDLRQLPEGRFVAAPSSSSVHLNILYRTITVSAAVCGLCLLLGLPVALILATVSSRLRNFLLIFVMLPFWTPVLVRTTAWIVLLQNEGVVNRSLAFLGLTDAPLPLMYSRTGVIVAMTHVLLPYMVLPIYVAMKGVSESYVRASLSLGAPPLTTIRRVYLPLISPGIRSGCVLVFVLALGFYITPALVGGPSDQMFSYLIAFHTATTLNWGMASALSLVLLASVGGLFLVITLLMGPARISLKADR